MSTATAETIAARLSTALDVDLLKEYHVKRGLALGLKPGTYENGTWGVQGAGDWPIFPNYRLNQVAIGQSRGILDVAYIHESRLRSSDPDPESPQVGFLKSEARKQVFLSRAKDSYGEWSEDMTQGFQDGLLYGRGVCEAHAVDAGPFQRVCLTHYPVTSAVFDPYERNLTKARYVGLMRLVRLEDAEAKWGKKAAQDNVRRMREDRAGSPPLEVVPATVYYDVDEDGKGRYPTRAVVLGNVGSAPVEVEESRLDCLPIGLCLGFLPGGMAEGIGAFDRLLSVTEAIGEFERKMRARMLQPDLLVVDPSQLDEKDVAALVAEFRKSYNIHVIRTKLPQGSGFHFQQCPPLTQADLEWGNRLERMRAEASGLSEIDRGAALDKQATKFEVQEVQEASSLNAAGPQKQTLDYVRRCIEAVLKVAAVYDTEPLWVDLDGANVLLNDPSDPSSSIGELMREKSRIVVGTDSLTVQDDERRRRRRYADIADFAQRFALVVDPAKAAAKAGEALRISEDVEDLLLQPGQAPPGLPGAPGQPTQAAV